MDGQEIELTFKAERIRGTLLGLISYLLYSVIMITITILFCLVICVTCIGKLKDLQARRQVNPSNSGSNSLIGAQGILNGQENGRQANDGDEDSERDKNTLQEEDIDKWMPIINLKEEKKKGHKIFDEICTICLEKIENGDPLRRIKICKHTFHAKCLTDWLSVNETCPNCKEDLSKKALAEKEKLLW